MRRDGVRRWFRLPVRDRLMTEADVEAELASHLDERVERLVAQGLSEPEARAEAERRLGGLAQARWRLVHEAWTRDAALSRRDRVRVWVDDFRYALRVLQRAPVFTVAAVSTLSLAFALVASATSLVNAYVLRSMPYPDADRLYHVNYAPRGEPEPRGLSAMDWRALSAVIEHADDSTPTRLYLDGGAYRKEVMGLRVAGGSVDLLGVTAALGRSLNQHDFDVRSEAVALIGDELWRTRYAADSTVIGQVVHATGASDGRVESFRIIGVLPANFRFARAYGRGPLDFVAPLREPARAYMVQLRAGVPVPRAQEMISDAVRRTATWLPPRWTGVSIESVHHGYVATLRPVLWSVSAAAGIVLVIAALNLAVLMLLRAVRRQRESALRVALGAGRAHLLRLQLAESGLICGSALVLGVVVSVVSLRVLAPVIEERLGRDVPGGTQALAIDARVLIVMAVVGITLAVLLSLVPMLSAWQRTLTDSLRHAGRSATPGLATRRLSSALVALQVAASLALLVGCGLMIRTVLNLVGTNLGFHTEQVVRARIALPPERYADEPSFVRFYDQLAERLAASSMQFAFTTVVPFYEYPQDPLEIESRERDRVEASVMGVGDGYFDLLGMSLREGRGFTAEDRAGAAPVAIVSASLADRLWPPGSALGQRIRRAQDDSNPVAGEWRTIIGVSNDVRQTHTDIDLDDLYIPFAQAPGRYAPVYARTAQPPLEWLALLREHAAAIDPLVLVTGDVVNSSLIALENRLLAGPRFIMTVLTGFAMFAVLLTGFGVYGVTAYAVQQRERELAIRAAVGATRRQLILLFVYDGVRLLAGGIAAGVFGAAVIGQLLEHQLHGVKPIDVSTLLLAGVFIASVSLLASWWPAARVGSSRNPFAVLNEG